MNFLDRQCEMERLERLVARKAAGLVALWGRRRVGKTRLLAEWCFRHGGVYTVADESAETVQRRYFAEAVSEKLTGFKEVEYPDWMTLLRRLSANARAVGWKGPVVFDEFPYLVLSSPTLPSVMQNWVDQEAARDGMLVAIAGSSQAMMQGLVLDHTAPLYGRALEAFSLSPLPAGWIGEALGIPDPQSALQAYSVWGGIPRYWELAAPFGIALDDAVDALALDPLSPLHQEPDRLLREETPAATALRPLLDVIGNGCHRPSEIAARLGVPATSLSKPLARLQELGLIIREIPFGESSKSSKRALYRISDPFFAFWFRVVAPHRGLLAGAPRPVRLHFWREAKPALVSRVWEQLARTAFSKLAGDDATPGWLPAARWWQGSAPEWDLVSASTDGRKGALGEVKWSAKPFDQDSIRTLVRTLSGRPIPHGMPSEVQRFVIVPAVADGTDRLCEGVQIITADQVFSVLR